MRRFKSKALATTWYKPIKIQTKRDSWGQRTTCFLKGCKNSSIWRNSDLVETDRLVRNLFYNHRISFMIFKFYQNLNLNFATSQLVKRFYCFSDVDSCNVRMRQWSRLILIICIFAQKELPKHREKWPNQNTHDQGIACRVKFWKLKFLDNNHLQWSVLKVKIVQI